MHQTKISISRVFFFFFINLPHGHACVMSKAIDYRDNMYYLRLEKQYIILVPFLVKYLKLTKLITKKRISMFIIPYRYIIKIYSILFGASNINFLSKLSET